MGRDRETVARLQDAIEQTRALYEGAKHEFHLATERYSDLGATHPDGSLKRATRVYTQTLRNYISAVVRLNRYLLEGELPDGEASDSNRRD